MNWFQIKLGSVLQIASLGQVVRILYHGNWGVDGQIDWYLGQKSNSDQRNSEVL